MSTKRLQLIGTVTPTVDETLTISGTPADAKKVGDIVKELDKNKVSLPVDSEGNVSHGTVGQFAVSDGKGGYTWYTVVNGNEVSY